MKQKVLDTFCELGFQLELIEELDYYLFSYEGTRLMYMPSENDEHFLNIAAACVYESEGENDMVAAKLKEEINSTLKYVKAYEMGSGVWIFHEHEISEGDDLERIISLMVQSLDTAVMFAHAKLKEMEEKDEEATEENDEE